MFASFYIFITIFLISIFNCTLAEQLGDLKFTDLTLRPYGEISEGQKGSFNLNESFLAFEWRLNSQISSAFGLGSEYLLNKSIHYKQESTDQLGLIEGYAQFESTFLKVRFGLVPLEYGLEGSLRENELKLPRSLIYESKIIPLRDYGVYFNFQNKGVYTNLTFHNGESQTNLDNRVWLTSTWGWTDFSRTKIGLSGQTGTTKPESTFDSGDTLAGVDTSLEAKWRMASLFLDWQPHRWMNSIEITWGEVEQENKTGNKFLSSHWDIGYKLEKQSGIIGRFDILEPNDKLKGDMQKNISLAWFYETPYGNSRVYVIATRKEEESDFKINNDSLKILWHIGSQSLDKSHQKSKNPFSFK